MGRETRLWRRGLEICLLEEEQSERLRRKREKEGLGEKEGEEREGEREEEEICLGCAEKKRSQRREKSRMTERALAWWRV